MALATVRDFTSQLMDTTTRPEVVQRSLVRLGAEKVLSPKHIELVASLTTVQALMDKGVEIQGIAMPYLQKARVPEGRKELVMETNEKLIKPTREVVAPYIQPYVDRANERLVKPTCELAAPYVAKLETTAAAIRESPRYQAAISQLDDLRAHPLETVQGLKTKAADLVKPEDIAVYRAYLKSPEFQADTLKLIREDLPAIARDAARRSMEMLHTKATALNAELQGKRAALTEAWKKGYEKGMSIELDDLRARARLLVAELQCTLVSKVEAVKGTAAEYNTHEVIARLTKIFGLDAIFKGSAAEAGEPAAEEPTQEPKPEPVAAEVTTSDSVESAE
mmetsp:Transcript_20302/g.64182  ORF Transcript_20302/g.64182 Transcript_20302/m.64182 type:complete len:336 (+) Transcript_20302:99-1106(+)